MIARTPKNAMITNPVSDLVLRRKTNRCLPDVVVSAVVMSGVSSRSVRSMAMSALLPGPRVERGVDEVGNDVGDEDGEGDHQEAALHEGVVVRRHGGEQDVADALV